MEQLISTILPNWVYGAEVFGLSQEVIFEEEASLTALSVPKRRAEFLTGRKCAHVALSRLGVPSTPILRGPKREPIWPEGVVGSITHCGNYCAAAVASSEKDRWIGIDAESTESLPAGIIDVIASPSEIQLAAVVMREIPNWDRLIFCAKESVFKAWYPCHQTWLDFLDVSITFFPESSNFDVNFISRGIDCKKRMRAIFCGRYLICADIMLTSVVARTVSDARGCSI